MRPFLRRVLSVLVLATLSGNAAQRLATLDETVTLSEIIVHGTVVDASARWVEDDRGRHIYTFFTVESIEYWKGDGDERIVVEWPGGTVGQMTEHVSHIPSLDVDEEVVLFLNNKLRPAVGSYSKYRINNDIMTGFHRQEPITTFKATIKHARDFETQPPKPENVAIRELLTIGTVEPLSRWESSIAITGINPETGIKTLRSTQDEGPHPAAVTTIYDNTTTSANFFNPGTDEIRDFGTSPGGTVVEFAIAYATWLSNPGNIIIRFYTGTTTSSMGTFITGFSLPGSMLPGSSSPGTWQGKIVQLSLSVDDQFVLPGGAIGYSYQFAGSDTGALCATGGEGIADAFWLNNNLTWFGGSPYASFYMKVNAQEGEPGLQPSISSITPGSASAGTDTSVTITGANFGTTQGSSTVNFFYRSGQPTIPGTVTSWSDTSITCIVPVGNVGGYPASASSGPVTVTTSGGTSSGYTFSVPFGYMQMKWPGDWPSVEYFINENCSDTVNEGETVQSAAATWSNAGAQFAFVYGGSHDSTTASYNGSNEILWGMIDVNPFAIAVAWTWSIGESIVESDIVFNSDYSWSTSGSPSAFDVQTIAVHEMGHSLGLRDLYGNIGDGINDNGKIMYGFAWDGLVKRELADGDRDGIRWIYGLVTTVNITFDAQGGTAPVPDSKVVTLGEPYGLLASTARGGYTFDGWWTGAGGTGSEVTAATTVTTASNHTLYAKWIPNTYTVTLDRQSGSGGSGSVTATYGAPMPSATAPSRTGYTFDGYFDQSGGAGTRYYNANMSSARNWDKTAAATLFAHWIINTYTVTFLLGEHGTFVSGELEQTIAHGQAAIAPEFSVAHGWEFDGWDADFDNVMSNVTVNARYVPAVGTFARWLLEHEIDADPAECFQEVCPERGVYYGFAYVFGNYLPADGVLMNFFVVEGRTVLETPLQNPDTLPYAEVRVLGATDLLDAVWNLPIIAAQDTTGKPADRAWFEPAAPTPVKAFFRVQAELK